MKAPTLAGIVLIVLAVIAFSYQGITYTKREKVFDIGPIEATAEKKETIPLPPILELPRCWEAWLWFLSDRSVNRQRIYRCEQLERRTL